MEVGILTMPSEAELEKIKKAKKETTIGVSVKSLLADIEFNLYRTKYDAATVLQLIHHDLLLLDKRIKVTEKNETTE